ncbi:MAG TPA: carboxypeptidase regulatory-like domain-containing protein [Bryobacteraceae bacterium]|nr:carboxypeptidase regulatory-like domain-containing protein [Bryobacteraceae bacterium]
MNKLFGLLSAIILAVLISLYPPALQAQAISGDVTGSILDSTGAAVPGATITAVNDATGVKTIAHSESGGTFRFTNLPVGAYTMSATAPGFSTATLKNVSVVLSEVVTANLTLEVGKASTVVEVSSAAAAIDTTTAQLQSTFDTQQVQQLPSASRGTGIYNLSLVGSGVTSQGGVGQGYGPAISGQRPDNNVYNLDGVPNDNRYNPSPLVYTSNDSIAEVSLLENQFSPEFGGGSGGVFNAIVKTGTNQLHGSVYEYFQNRNLNAVDSRTAVQNLTSNPRFDNNRLGASIGGPIIRNKLFYFGNFEYNPIGSAATPSALFGVTAAGLATLNSLGNLSKNNLGVFEKYVPVAPVANQGTIQVTNGTASSAQSYTIPIGNISVVSPGYSNAYDAVVALDYNISDKDQVRGRWIYNNYSAIDTGATLPIFDVPSPNNNYLISISEFHSFNATLQNEFRSSFSRNFNQLGVPSFTFPGLAAFPNITLDDLNSLNIGPDGPSGSIQNLLQGSDHISKVAGRHNLKFGYDFVDVILTNYFIQRVRGDYYYLNTSDFLNDLSPTDFGERSAGPTSYPAGFLQHDAFASDDWHIARTLTLNLGLRYEYVTMPIASRYQSYSALASVPGVFTVGEPHFSKNDWSPRIGIAWSPGSNGTWSVRAGFARAFNPTYANLTSNAAPPYFQQTNDVNVDHITPNFLANGGLNGNAVPLPNTQMGQLAILGSYTFSNNRPYGLTWTGGVQHEFKHNYTMEVRYTGTKGVHLWNQTRLNIDQLVSPTNYIPTFFSMPSAATLAGLSKTLSQVESYIVPGGTAAQPFNALAVYGSLANITAYAPQAYSQYHGLAVQVNKRLSNGLTFVAAYTWSHTIDDATATNFSTYLTPRRAQDFQNLAAEKSSSALDHRQRFTFSPIYTWLPFKGGNWFEKNLLGNWTISGTYTYETPEYATVQSGIDSNLNNDSAGDRAIINEAGAANLSTAVYGVNNLGHVTTSASQIVAYVANNPNARYVQAGAGALSNGGRNTFPLFPTDNLDAALTKSFNITERIKFSISGQFLNVLNHPQWTGGYISDIASNGYTASRNDLVTGNALFGRFDQFYSSNSRTSQIAAHITF